MVRRKWPPWRRSMPRHCVSSFPVCGICTRGSRTIVTRRTGQREKAPDLRLDENDIRWRPIVSLWDIGPRSRSCLICARGSRATASRSSWPTIRRFRPSTAPRCPGGCTLITIGYNSGIAHAQNAGIAAALAAGAEVLVFFDQDSKIEPGFVKSLVSALREGAAEIVSPLSVDEATNTPLPSVRVSRFGWSTPVHTADAVERYPVDMVISSGTAATRQVFEIAGTFDEGLFIDFVDAEWCLRCRSLQIPIYVVPSLGDASQRRSPALQVWNPDDLGP